MRRTALLLAAFLCARTTYAQNQGFQQPLPYPTPTPGVPQGNWSSGAIQSFPQGGLPGATQFSGIPQYPSPNGIGQTAPAFPTTAMPSPAPVNGAKMGAEMAPWHSQSPADFRYTGQAVVSQSVPGEHVITFDPARVELQWENGQTVLRSGATVLKEFHNQREAQEALQIIRELRLNQVGRVGTPKPVMEYWLHDGQAPFVSSVGNRVVPLDAATLRVEQVQGQWFLRNNVRSLFAFGPHPDEAQRALDVVRHYGFTQVGYVGQGSPSMLVFLGSPSQQTMVATPNTPMPMTANTSSVIPGRHIANAMQPVVANEAAVQQELTHGQEIVPQATGAAMPGIHPVGVPSTMAPGLKPASAANHAPSPGESSAEKLIPERRQSLLEAMHGVERVPFDARRVQVRQDNGEWKLIFGSSVLGSFGHNEQDAKLALAAAQHYHLSERDAIGSPQPTFSYFLTGGQAPRGSMPGLQGIPFQPGALVVKKLPDGWAICNGPDPLLRFGNRGGEALQAAHLMERYKFDYIAHIGHGGSDGMTLFLRAH